MQPVRPAAVQACDPNGHRHENAADSLVSSQTNGEVHSAVLQQKPQRLRLAQNRVPAVAQTQTPAAERGRAIDEVADRGSFGGRRHCVFSAVARSRQNRLTFEGTNGHRRRQPIGPPRENPGVAWRYLLGQIRSYVLIQPMSRRDALITNVITYRFYGPFLCLM